MENKSEKWKVTCPNWNNVKLWRLLLSSDCYITLAIFSLSSFDIDCIPLICRWCGCGSNMWIVSRFRTNRVYLHIEFYSQEVGKLLNRNNCWNKSIFPAHIIHKNSYTTARPVRQVIINHGQVLLSSSLIPLNCVILRRLLPPPTSLESIIFNYYIIESLGTNQDHV